VGAGVALYDILGLSMGNGRGLPLHRHLTKRQALATAPGLDPRALSGAVLYYDAQVDDARYVVELVRTAVSYGAVALNRLARFMIDPRDERTTQEYFDLVGTDEGIFGCMGLLACEDVCPKQIPLQEQLGKLRRKMALAAVNNILPKFLKPMD